MTVEHIWLAFGDRLRQLRKPRVTARSLATAAGWQPSKVSRIENGQQVISEADLSTWCRVLDLSAEDTAALLGELRSARLEAARWKHRLGTGHRPIQEAWAAAEQRTKLIRNVEPALTPGLLQTPEYAHAVFTLMAQLKDSPADADQAVSSRLERQRVLYDPGKTIEILTTEAALRAPIAPPDVMAAQVDRLLNVPGLKTVRFGVIPLDVELPAPLMHGFWILDDVVTIEVYSTELVIQERADVEMYNGLVDDLWKVAVSRPDDVRTLLRGVADRYQS